MLIKSRISNSQKDNWLDLPKLGYQYHREICGTKKPEGYA